MIEENKIGEYLRSYRKDNDITLRELSKKTGISFSHLSKIERGEHTPTKTTLSILADALLLDKSELYVKAGYAPLKKGVGLEAFFSPADPKEEEKLNVIKKISEEFPDADLMFHDLASLDAEQLEDVYEFIKFKSQQKK
ncbi:helix-turn-helix domain-containing protein [Virgibacillus halophilus]|uniref:Helix-turn-helix transcriptional regulator n=1 Tax=Tigheibacillus halophilus TaxID=361280 RepID=A0ABU5C5Y5_9BACI|nr:helix-turn-helix transcriptional regulator [Virgibacillus halophilus]